MGSADSKPRPASHDDAIYLWTTTGCQTARFTQDGSSFCNLTHNSVHSCELPSGIQLEELTYHNPLALTSDCEWILRRAEADRIEFVKWRTGEITISIRSSLLRDVSTVIFAPDDSWFLALGTHQCTAWSLSTGLLLWSFPPPQPGGYAHGAADISPDGRRVAIACGLRVSIVDSCSGKRMAAWTADFRARGRTTWKKNALPLWMRAIERIGLFPLYKRNITYVSFLSDTDSVMVVHADHGRCIWNWRTQRLESDLGPMALSGLVLSADRTLAKMGNWIWDTRGWRQILTCLRSGQAVFSPALDSMILPHTMERFSIPDGQPLQHVMRRQRLNTLEALSIDLRWAASAQLFDERTPVSLDQEPPVLPRDPSTGYPVVRREVYEQGVIETVGPVELRADHTALSVDLGGTVYFSGIPLIRVDGQGTWRPSPFAACDISWDGGMGIAAPIRNLSTGKYPQLEPYGLYELASASHLRAGPESFPWSGEVKLSACARFCAATSVNSVVLGDFETRELLYVNIPQSGYCTSLCVAPGGTTLVVGNENGSAHVWLPQRDLLREISAPARRAVVFTTISDDGLRVLIGRFEDDVTLYRLDADGNVEDSHRVLSGHPLTARFAPSSHDFLVVMDSDPRFHFFVEAPEGPRSVAPDVFPPVQLPPLPHYPEPVRYPSWPDLTSTELEREAARLRRMNARLPVREWIPAVAWDVPTVLDAVVAALGYTTTYGFIDLRARASPDSDAPRFQTEYFDDHGCAYRWKVQDAGSFLVGIAVSYMLPVTTAAFATNDDSMTVWHHPRNDGEQRAFDEIRAITRAHGGLFVDVETLRGLTCEGRNLLDVLFIW